MDFKFSDSETQMFKDLSDIFILERAGKIINDKIYAFFCSNEYQSSIQTIDFKEILEDDILIHKDSGKRCIVIDVEPLQSGVIAKYETISQRVRKQQSIGNISIGNIGGSAIIGNQQYAIIDNSSIQNLKEMKLQDLKILKIKIETAIENMEKE